MIKKENIRKRGLVKKLKDVDFNNDFLISDVACIYTEDDTVYISIGDSTFMVNEMMVGELYGYRADIRRSKIFSVDIASFFMKEGKDVVVYFTVAHRESGYPLLVHKRNGNICEMCYFPKISEISNPSYDTVITGLIGETDLTSFNVCKNRTNQIKNPRKRKDVTKEMALLLKRSECNAILHKQINYLDKNLSKSQIDYGDLISIYQEKLNNVI